MIESQEIIGKRVIGDKGDHIGRIKDLRFDPDTWKVTELKVELERNVAEEYGIKSLWKGTIVRVDVGHVRAVGDSVILKISKEQLRAVVPDTAKPVAEPEKQPLASPTTK